MRARSPRRSSPPSGARAASRACDFLLDGLALLVTEGYAAGAPALKAALRAFREEPMAEEDELRWLWLACHIARALGDDVAWDELTARQVALARRAGALSLLPVALDEQVHADLFCGRLAAAKSHAAEADAVLGGDRQPPRPCAAPSRWRSSAATRPRRWR